MNFVYFSRFFDENFQQDVGYIDCISKEKIKDDDHFIELTDKEIETAKKDEFYATVRIVNGEPPKLYYDGDEIDETGYHEDDFFSLDELIMSYYNKESDDDANSL